MTARRVAVNRRSPSRLRSLLLKRLPRRNRLVHLLLNPRLNHLLHRRLRRLQSIVRRGAESRITRTRVKRTDLYSLKKYERQEICRSR